MRGLAACAVLSFSVSVFGGGAIAQQKDCRAITDPAARLKCFDQPLDCKTVSDPSERLKCFDAQSSAPAGPPAVVAPAPAPAPVPAGPPPEPAPRILKAEPPGGQLPHGAKLWIDDGSCPAGYIKEVVGGDVSLGMARVRSCVPRR